jgi:enoyl-CoA hydratase/carnithine racemase
MKIDRFVVSHLCHALLLASALTATTAAAIEQAFGEHAWPRGEKHVLDKRFKSSVGNAVADLRFGALEPARIEGLNEHNRKRFMDLFESPDQAEGVSAFLEKRKPVWKNG